MMNFRLIVFLAICATVLGINREKLSRRPPNQPKFKLDRWLGNWYLQARLASCSWSGSNEFQEWTQTLSRNNGKILASETWYNNVCATTSAILTQSQPGQGCFIVQDTLGNVWTGEQVIPATDYKTFSISWGCVKESLDGKTCDDPCVTVKTRHRNPSPYTWKVVEAILKKLFDLSLTDMKRISHENSRCSGGQNLVEVATSLGATTLVNFAKEASLTGALADGGKLTLVTATGSKVISVDNKASNGVIHVMDRVMFPLPVGPIPEIASNYPELSTLVLSVGTAGLGGTLSGSGPFTVFAPTNKAFNRLPPGVLDDLLANPDVLADVLKYHVVPATLYSAGLTSGRVTTLQGGKIDIKLSSGGVLVNFATVITADIPASNGVIHIIDKVLIP